MGFFVLLITQTTVEFSNSRSRAVLSLVLWIMKLRNRSKSNQFSFFLSNNTPEFQKTNNPIVSPKFLMSNQPFFECAIQFKFKNKFEQSHLIHQVSKTNERHSNSPSRKIIWQSNFCSKNKRAQVDLINEVFSASFVSLFPFYFLIWLMVFRRNPISFEIYFSY